MKPEAKLLNYSREPEKMIAIAAKLTHSKESSNVLYDNIDEKEAVRLTSKMIDLGHESTLEHSWFMFKFICSRTCSHQVVRQRIGTAFSQRSERYVDEGDFDYITPPDIAKNPQLNQVYKEHFNHAKKQYNFLRDKGIKKEDARFILPRISTEILVSFNGRSLRHFLKLRLDNAAQWEIRSLAEQVKSQINGVCPVLVKDF